MPTHAIDEHFKWYQIKLRGILNKHYSKEKQFHEAVTTIPLHLTCTDQTVHCNHRTLSVHKEAIDDWKLITKISGKVQIQLASTNGRFASAKMAGWRLKVSDVMYINYTILGCGISTNNLVFIFSRSAIHEYCYRKLQKNEYHKYHCCMMKPYIKDGKCAISSPMHTSVCISLLRAPLQT